MNKVATYVLAGAGALVVAGCLTSPAPPPPAEAKAEAPKQSPQRRSSRPLNEASTWSPLEAAMTVTLRRSWAPQDLSRT